MANDGAAQPSTATPRPGHGLPTGHLAPIDTPETGATDMETALLKPLPEYTDAELNAEWHELEDLDADWSASDGARFLAIEMEMARRCDF